MERILTKDEALDISDSIAGAPFEPASMDVLRPNTWAYLYPEVRVSFSGRISVHIMVPMESAGPDPYLRDCYSLREKFQDLEHFKHAYGI